MQWNQTALSANSLKCTRNQYAKGRRRWRRLTVGPQMRSHYLTHKDASRAHYIPAPLLFSVNEPNEASRTLTHAHKSFIMYTTTDNDLWINWCKHLRHAHTHQHTHQQTLDTRLKTRLGIETKGIRMRAYATHIKCHYPSFYKSPKSKYIAEMSVAYKERERGIGRERQLDRESMPTYDTD